MYVSFDFEVKVANKSELDTSASVRYKLYVIDADVFNSDLFSHHFNEEKQLQECLVIMYYVLAQSICLIHSNSHSLLKVCQM